MKTLISILMVLTLSPSWAQDGHSSSSQDFTQQYPHILRNNIFSRYRQAYVESQETQPVNTPPAPSVETYYVLKGITREHDTLIAFIEYNEEGTARRYGLNSHVAEGTVESISLDGLVYTQSGEDPNVPTHTQIGIGQNLLGQTVQSTTSYSDYDYSYNYNGSSASSSSSNSSSNEDSSDDTDAAALLKQLMERRQRELGR